MIDTQREKLLNWDGQFISIGVTEDGLPYDRIYVPWQKTSSAFSMYTPDVYICPDDLYDTWVITELGKRVVRGLYLFTPFADYSFISRFDRVKDLNVFNGDAITDLNFLVSLRNCNLLFLQGAKLKDLNVICDMAEKGMLLPSCIAFHDCEVGDLSHFSGVERAFMELVLWYRPEKDSKERWRIIPANYYKFREITDSDRSK